MSNFDKEKLILTVRKIARQIGFSEETDIILHADDEEKKGFMSEIIKIDVKDKETERYLYLLAKISMKDKKIRETAAFEETYNNEIYAYEKFIPALKQLEVEFKLSPIFESTVKFYQGSSNAMDEYLIMENLTKIGFEMLEIRQTLDHNHVKKIFQKLGEFHGLSFALKNLKTERYQNLKRGLVNAWKVCFQKDSGNVVKRIIVYMRNVMHKEGFKSRLLDYYAENMFQVMENMISHDEEEFSCYLHGDGWSNNLMFKYKVLDNNDKQLEEIKFLDWQFSNIGPPVQDLSYHLYSGASNDVLDNLDTYLEMYHTSLSRCLSRFNLNVEMIYPFEVLKEQWKKYGHFGAILGTCIWKIRSKESSMPSETSITELDDSTYFDDIVNADCDQKYLSKHIRTLYRHLDKILD